MGKRLVTKYQGVYERTAENRKHQGKPDICYDVSYKVDGKKVWEKAGWLSEGYTAKLAAQIRAERMRNIRHGEDPPKKKAKAPLFKESAEKYLKWAAENKTREGKDDERRYKSYLAPRFDEKRLDEISPFDLEKLKSVLTKKGLAPASVKHVLVVGVTDRRQLATFHTLRHTFASWLALQGETQLTIAEMLGHKDLKMTKRYSHPIQDHKRRAALNLEQAFRENRKKAQVITRTSKAIQKPRQR